MNSGKIDFATLFQDSVSWEHVYLPNFDAVDLLRALVSMAIDGALDCFRCKFREISLALR